MRSSQRLISAAVLLALASALTGCGSAGGFEPSDLLDWMDTKKKLPGDRRPVFPEGVPGVQQGVPKELYRGSAEQQQQQQEAIGGVPAAPAVAAAPQRGRGTKNRGSVNVGAVQEAAPVQDGAPAEEAAAPAPKPKKPVRRRTTAPPPDDAQVQQSAPAPVQQAAPPARAAQPAGSSFPAPLPSGSFQR